MQTEIAIFHPNSRKIQFDIKSLVPRSAVSALEERLGEEAASHVTRTINSMKRNDMESAQIRLGDRRVRVKLGA